MDNQELATHGNREMTDAERKPKYIEVGDDAVYVIKTDGHVIYDEQESSINFFGVTMVNCEFVEVK